MSDITSSVNSNKKVIVIAFLVLFSIVLVKGFFGVNNAFDTTNINSEDYDPYNVDTSAPEHVVEVGNKFTSFFSDTSFDIDWSSDTSQAAIFLLIVGLFVYLIGRN